MRFILMIGLVLLLGAQGCGDDSGTTGGTGGGGTGGDAAGGTGGGGAGGDGGSFDPFGDYGVFLSLVPPGSADVNGAVADDPNSTNQLSMYENLVFSDSYPTPGQLSEDDLVPDYFKDEALLPESSFDSPRTVSDGMLTARIGRDEFGVPHVFGDTRQDVYFGTGYATGEDRMFLIDVVRHIGRGRMSDFIGPSAGNYGFDRNLGRFGGYDEQELQAQIDQLADRLGVDGEQATEDVMAYVAGINQYISDIQSGAPGAEAIPVEYALLDVELLPFTARDVISTVTLVFSQFAVGGGREDQQSRLITGLADLYPGESGTACGLWRDTRQADDPERPNTTEVVFATQSPPTIDEDACPLADGFADEYPGAVLLDAGSQENFELLLIEDCVAPEMATGDDVECPNYREDVVDDAVVMANAAVPAGVLQAASLSAPRDYGSTVLTCSVDAQELERVREHALQRVEGIALALAEGTFPTAMSNAIVAAGSETESGFPIAVFGPQTGYTAPQLLMELAQHGAGVHNRGVTFAGLPYPIIGRGVDFAFSATSAGNDIIDVRVLRLCEPDDSEPTRDSRHYLYQGECTPMLVRTDEWTAETNITTPGPDQKVTRNIVRADDYGPVFATATVDGEPVALAIQRTTFFGEADSVGAFVKVSRNEATDPESFFEVFNEITGTFNWFYLDADNIAYFNSALLPTRAAGIHPDLPQWGTGEFDWAQSGTGRANPDFAWDNFLAFDAHPREANPASNYFINWNNAQAPGFWASDGQTSYGVIYRSDMLQTRLEAYRAQDGNPGHDRASMVDAMMDAGTTDLRAEQVLPKVFAVLDDVSDLTAFEQEVVQLMKDWVENGPSDLGAMRRDRDGPPLNPAGLEYEDHDAVAFMDAWWDSMIDAVLPQLTEIEDA
ncbi:MAG: penicillin acylase family protein, partial [Myxococcota bacterium]